MVLVVTNRGDLTADWLIFELQRRTAEYLRFNTEDYPTAVTITWVADGPASMRIADKTYAFDDFESVWYRRPVPPALPEGVEEGLRHWATAEAQAALDGLWRTMPSRWVNHPDANSLADSKPEQLRTAPRLGFSVPATLVTNDPTTARDFADTCGKVVCKPLYDGLVTRAGEEHLFWATSLDQQTSARLEELGPEPYLLPAQVPKEADVRVTVVGQRVFGVAIRTPPGAPADWRRTPLEQLEHEVLELPDELSHRCLALVEHYGLRFAAVDLALTGDGYEFFELNPYGQWAWLEEKAGIPLRAAMADLLLGE
jgi:hypothetical protein